MLAALAHFAAPAATLAKPDLRPTAIVLDSITSVLEITIANEGDTGIGWAPSLHARVFVDGRERKRLYLHPLGSLLQPGESVDISTGLLLGGDPKHVLVVVDPDDVLDEEFELQNELSRLVEPAPSALPDLVISDVGAGRLGVRFTFSNQNYGITPSNLAVNMVFSINNTGHQTRTFILPPLDEGQSYSYYVFGVYAEPGDVIRASFTSSPYFGEIDLQNNRTEWTIPATDWREKYDQLLADPEVGSALYWRGTWNGSYATWPLQAQEELFGFLEILETGQDLPLPGLPYLGNVDSYGGGDIVETDAWLIYLAHVAHSLWLDASGLVTWRLSSYPDAWLRLLLDSTKLFVADVATGLFRFNVSETGIATVWNPQISFRFLQALNHIGPSHLSSIYALTDWMRSHVAHVTGYVPFQVLYGYEGYPPVDRMLYPPAGQTHITPGCPMTTGLYSGVLRTLNIPVKRAGTALATGAHARPSFVSADRTLAHGDDPYSLLIYPSGNPSPIRRIFYVDTAVNGPQYPDPPTDLDCNSQGVCNNTLQQSEYNLVKDQWDIAIDHMTDQPLYLVSKFGWQALTDALIGDFALPYYDAYDRYMIMLLVIDELDRVGDGDVNVGAARVIERYERFRSAK